MSDTYDGATYQEHKEFFPNKFNVSFSFNFDGAPTFKSSKMQLWPVQLYINELPPHLRYNNITRIHTEYVHNRITLHL